MGRLIATASFRAALFSFCRAYPLSPFLVLCGFCSGGIGRRTFQLFRPRPSLCFFIFKLLDCLLAELQFCHLLSNPFFGDRTCISIRINDCSRMFKRIIYASYTKEPPPSRNVCCCCHSFVKATPPLLVSPNIVHTYSEGSRGSGTPPNSYKIFSPSVNNLLVPHDAPFWS